MEPTSARMTTERGRLVPLAWAALLLVIVVPIGWGAHQPFSWDPDNIAPGSVLRAMAARFGPGWHSSYGPLPYLLTAAVYLPILFFMRLAGELGIPSATYPWGFAHPDVSIALLIIAARTINVLMALAVVTIAARERPPSLPARRGWLLPLLALGSATFVYYARTSNVEIAYLFWLWLGMHLAEGASTALPRLMGAGVAAAFAVCSKEQSAPIAAVILGAAAIRAFRLRRTPAGRIGATLAVIIAALAAYALAWDLPWNLQGFRAHHDFILNVARYDRTYPATAAGFLGLAANVVRLLPVALGWGILSGLALALALRVPVGGLGLRALAIGAYLVAFIAAIGYVYPRFLLPVLLIALPLAARGWNAAWNAFGRRRLLGSALAATFAALLLTGGPNLGALQLRDPRYEAERWLAANVPAGGTVEVAGNPRFQARAPRGRTVFYTTLESIRRDHRGPRGDVVLLSTLDASYFRSDPVPRAVWWDSLAGPAAVHYRRARVFRPGAGAGLARGLFVSPTVDLYLRAEPGAQATGSP